MGLDGGTIITRSDVLRGQSWEVASSDDGARSSRGGQVSTSYTHKRKTLDAEQRTDALWHCCALSEEPLGPDAVACGAGRLYNREAVVEHLLARKGVFASDLSEFQLANRVERAASIALHLRSKADVFPVKLTPAERADASEAGARWVCPVTSLPAVANGAPFVAIRPCGHVVAQRAAKEVGGKSCPACGAEAAASVQINGPPEVQREVLEALEREHERREQKRAKKQAREGAGESGGGGGGGGGGAAAAGAAGGSAAEGAAAGGAVAEAGAARAAGPARAGSAVGPPSSGAGGLTEQGARKKDGR